MDSLVIGIAVALAVILAVVVYFTQDRLAARFRRGRRGTDGDGVDRGRADGVERLDTTGPDSGGQRQGGHVNPYMPPIRQDGINNPGGF